MFEGRIATWDEVQFRAQAGVSGRMDIPNGSFGGGATLTTGFTPDYIDYSLGLILGAYSDSYQAGGGQTRYVFGCDAFGYSLERAVAAFDASPSTLLRLVGVRLTVEATATWLLEVDRIVWVGGGVTFLDEVRNLQLRSGMVLTPGSIPVIGVPCALQAVAGTDPIWGYPIWDPDAQPPFEFSTEGGAATIAASGGWRYLAGGVWRAPPVSLATSAPPGDGTPMGSVSAPDTWSLSATASYEFSGRYETGTNAWVMGLPSPERKVVRMESGHLSTVVRGGFPDSYSRGSRLRQETEALGGELPSERVDDEPLVMPAHSAFLAAVGDASHTIEDPLSTACRAPYGISGMDHRAGARTVVSVDRERRFPARVGDGSGGYGATSPYLTHAASMPTYVNAWANPHWSYWLWVPPDGSGGGNGWPAFGGTQDPSGYWLPIRQGMTRHSALPVAERTNERYDVLAEALGTNGLAGLMSAVAPNGTITSYWGVADLTPLPLPSVEAFAWSAASASLWSLPPEGGAASFSVGSGGVTVVGAGEVRLDLGSWTVAPLMLPRLMRRLTVGWSALPTGARVRAWLEGEDGERLLLTDSETTGPGTYDVPVGAARKRTGTYGQDFGAGVGDDSGIAAAPLSADASARMAGEAEASLSALSPAARSWTRLVYGCDPGSGASVTLSHPAGVVDTGDMAAVRESAQWAAFLLKSGPMVRLGGQFWNPITDALLDEPLLPPFGCPTAWDALAWRASVWRGDRPTADAGSLARESGWVEGREWISPKHLARDPFQQAQVTTAFVARGAGGRPLPIIVNTYRGNTPPLATFPRPTRSAATDWAAGAPGMESYTLASPWRGVYGMGGEDPRIVPPPGPAWRADEALSLPAGWAGRRYRVSLDGSEALDWALRLGARELAKGRPHRGYGLWWGGLGRSGSVHLYADQFGPLFLRTVASDGTVRTRTNEGAQVWTGEVGSGDSAQSYVMPDGRYVCALSDGGATLISESFDQGTTWVSVGMAISGTLPAVAVERATGIEATATYAAGGWSLWRRLPGEATFTLVGTIATGAERQAGLAFDPGTDGAMRFDFDDGSGVASLYSRDHGETWTST